MGVLTSASDFGESRRGQVVWVVKWRRGEVVGKRDGREGLWVLLFGLVPLLGAIGSTCLSGWAIGLIVDPHRGILDMLGHASEDNPLDGIDVWEFNGSTAICF